MRGAQHQTVTLASGSYLEYLPDFTIPYRGSRFINQTDIVIAEDAFTAHFPGESGHRAMALRALPLIAAKLGLPYNPF